MVFPFFSLSPFREESRRFLFSRFSHTTYRRLEKRERNRGTNQILHNQSPSIPKYFLSTSPAIASLARDFRCFASVGIRSATNKTVSSKLRHLLNAEAPSLPMWYELINCLFISSKAHF